MLVALLQGNTKHVLPLKSCQNVEFYMSTCKTTCAFEQTIYFPEHVGVGKKATALEVATFLDDTLVTFSESAVASVT